MLREELDLYVLPLSDTDNSDNQSLKSNKGSIKSGLFKSFLKKNSRKSLEKSTKVSNTYINNFKTEIRQVACDFFQSRHKVYQQIDIISQKKGDSKPPREIAVQKSSMPSIDNIKQESTTSLSSVSST